MFHLVYPYSISQSLHLIRNPLNVPSNHHSIFKPIKFSSKRDFSDFTGQWVCSPISGSRIKYCL